MDLGITIDSSSSGASIQAEWHAGQPKYSKWTGLKVSKDLKMPITTYRCPKCGYLESYAMPKPLG